MDLLLSIITANLLISLLSLAGVFTIALSFLKNEKASTMMVSFAAGVLLATAFLNILHEAIEGMNPADALSWAMFGVICAFLMERCLLWYHHHHEDSHNINPTSILVLAGDGVHNFIDGLAIAAAYIANPALGITATIAIAAHEIPQELADYSILRHCGLSQKHALLWNFLSGLAAVGGGIVGYYVFKESFDLVYYALAITAGIFMYVSLADLIPELHHSKTRSGWLMQTALFLIGVALVYGITGSPLGQH
jgi:zinc and cadmium transporter